MALMDAGWPDRPLDLDRTAVIIGNALSGEKHYLTALRIMFPELARELEGTAGFAALPADVRSTIEGELRARFEAWLPVITEDTMPGELGNCIAGRIANLFNLHGPNFTTDAACASALAAMDATVDGLLAHEFDVAITGGIDRNMGAHTFVKFCAIGALSPSGTRPYSDGADGFVMGEGGALFVVKRLADAVRDDDRIYAVVRGVGSSSDGKGKGITAPNPVGQRFAVERAWRNAGLSPAECTLVEGHGTSTSVGDAVELKSLMEAFSGAQLPRGSIALGSVKSNIGHLKGAAGAAGILKTTLALHDKVLPPSINFERPNSNVDWSASPFAVNTELRDWDVAAGRSRVAGVSAFGFGGTNFHLVMEEYLPDRHATNGHGSSVAVPVEPPAPAEPGPVATGKAPSARLTRPGSPTRSGRSWRRRGRAAISIRRRRRPRRFGPRNGSRSTTPTAPTSWRRRSSRCACSKRATRRRGRRCVAAASTAAAAALARWRSSTPARARNTRTCWPSCASGSRSWPNCSRKRMRSWLRCWRAAACPTSSSPTRRTRRRWPAPRRSSGAPRSSSRRSSPSTPRSRGCSASTESPPTW
jgi:acyl transferase domain-containing protein